MELFARVALKALPKALYERLLGNDRELVREYAFDAQLHQQKGAPLCFEALAYRIEGEQDMPEGEVELTLSCPVALGVRLHKLIREVLGISGKQFEQLVGQGSIRSLDGLNLMKARMGTLCRVLVRL